MKQPFFLGIDGGGSKCKARLEDYHGNLLAEYISGPANPSRDYEKAVASILDAVEGVFAHAQLNSSEIANTHATIGLAGLNIPRCLEQMKAWQHPFATLSLTTDLHIACVGAHQQANGAIVIIGTGSSGVVCHGDTQLEFGGHGFLLGDKASGAWFGAESIRCALECLDGIQPTSPFLDALLSHIDCNTSNKIVEQYLNANPSQFAQIAPLVFEFAEQHKDPVAIAIVKRGAEYIDVLCAQMLKHNPTRFAFIGGLSHKLIPWLQPQIQTQLCAPLNAPEVGAILIARQHNLVGKKLA